MGKFILYTAIYAITGNPFLALIAILAVYVLVDRAFLGFIPDPFRAFRKSSRIKELKNVVSDNPGDGRSLKELGVLLAEKGDFAVAKSYFEKAEAKMSDDAEFDYHYGVSAARCGDVAKGREWLDRALRISPRLKYGEPYLAFAEILIEREDYEGALPLLENFLKIHSSSSRGLYQMGTVKLKLGMKEEGESCLRESVKAFKASPFFKRKTDRKWAWKSRFLLTQVQCR